MEPRARLTASVVGKKGEYQPGWPEDLRVREFPTLPAGWKIVHWKAGGGYGSQRADGSNNNPARERIWFSPACLQAEGQLFEA